MDGRFGALAMRGQPDHGIDLMFSALQRWAGL